MMKGALIGFGKIAQTGHIPAWIRAMHDGEAAITAVYDTDLRAKAECRRMYPFLRFYDNIEELLATERPDFIDICSPPHSHLPLIKEAMSRGIHILCEKPVCQSYKEFSATAPLLLDYGKVFLPCHQYKFSAVWREFQSAAENLKTSDTQNARGIKMSIMVERTKADPGISRDASPAWRLDKNQSGGGIIADTGYHYLYLVRWILGEIKQISAKAQRISNELSEVEDNAQMEIICERGICEILLSWTSAARSTRAGLALPGKSLVYTDNMFIRTAGGTYERIDVPSLSDKSCYVLQYRELFREFFSRIISAKSNSDTVDEAVCTMKAVETAYVSAEAERAISFDR